MVETFNQDDIDTIKKAVQEMVNGFYRMQAERDNHSSIVAMIKEKELLPPKQFKALAKIAYEDSAKKKNDELTEILDLAEVIGIYSHEESNNNTLLE